MLCWRLMHLPGAHVAAALTALALVQQVACLACLRLAPQAFARVRLAACAFNIILTPVAGLFQQVRVRRVGGAQWRQAGARRTVVTRARPRAPPCTHGLRPTCT